MTDYPEGIIGEEVDATGKFVLPCWCDSHTHLVFAGSRESEFVDRINGLTYQEIANKIEEPLSNVKIKILRAKKLLAEIIQKNNFLGLSILAEIIKKIPSWDCQTIYKQRTTIYVS